MNFRLDPEARVKIRARSEIKVAMENGLYMTFAYPKDASLAGIIKDLMILELQNSGEEGLQEIMKAAIKSRHIEIKKVKRCEK